ncbi:hypothetical protein BD626DRAFT_571285 [Schizophyllum amplum]|uniref:Uncharacterized protein n=1 Tax=Schizophyllum amplum TaxID=97359 RepID=A0A550C7X5_9AGAR|nr:hypothetical protein BD626DRAFT_571285 [Auriculariopsis ampla]
MDGHISAGESGIDGGNSDKGSESEGVSYKVRHKRNGKKKRLHKARQLPDSDQDSDGSHNTDIQPRVDKGKGRAIPPPVDPPTLPDDLLAFEEDDSAPEPLSPNPDSSRSKAAKTAGPSHTRHASVKWKPGPVPHELVEEGEAAVHQALLTLVDVSIRAGKPLSHIYRRCGDRVPDPGKTRHAGSLEKYRQWFAAKNTTVAKKDITKVATAEWRAKLATIQGTVNEGSLYELFKEQYDYCRNLTGAVKAAEFEKDRQRDMNKVAKDMEKIANGIALNYGFSFSGILVDVEGTIGGDYAKSAQIGGGPAYEYMMRHYPVNFTRALAEQTTLMRAAYLDSRGASGSGDATGSGSTGGVDGPKTYLIYPKREWREPDKMDHLISILWDALTEDLGRYYTWCGKKYTSSSRPGTELAQFPRTKFRDLCYILGIVLVNWPVELSDNWPRGPKDRKPRGHCLNIVRNLCRQREAWEDTANASNEKYSRTALGRALYKSGAPGLVCISEEELMSPVDEQCKKIAIVRAPPPPSIPDMPMEQTTVIATRAQSAMCRDDVDSGTDRRHKWQDCWPEDERNNGQVPADADVSD